jgi:hypothetical protein
MTRYLLPRLALALAACAAPLAAQDAESGVPWRLSYFPYLQASPNDGVMGIARAIWFQQADWDARTSLRRSIAIDAGYSTRDAWLARVTYADPTIATNWRAHAVLEAGREPRFGDVRDPIARERFLARAEVTRRAYGPVQVAVQLVARHDRFEGTLNQLDTRYPLAPRETPEFFDAPTTSAIAQTDLTARGAIILDLRDREYEVNSGVLAELGLIAGSAGDGYQGVYGSVRGYVSPRRGTRLTARGAFRSLTETQAVAALHELPQWESPVTTFGGHGSHRGFGTGHFAGRGLLLGGLELRHDILNMGDFGAITAIAFVDGGRVFADTNSTSLILLTDRERAGRLRLTLDDWQWGAGGGVALRVLRAATLTITASGGDGETRWYVGSGWSW